MNKINWLELINGDLFDPPLKSMEEIDKNINQLKLAILQWCFYQYIWYLINKYYGQFINFIWD